MSSNRYSALNRRPGAAAASSLFADYPGSRPSSSTPPSRSGYGNYGDQNTSSPYNSNPYGTPNGHTPPLNSGYRPATPNKKGQYPTSVYSSLESQPPEQSFSAYDQTHADAQASVLSSKVSQLKQLTVAIGDEIRDSSSLAQTINDQFENSSVRLKGTMKRMLRMAERTGVGWRVWLGFFVVVWMLFVYVWLF